MEGFGVESVQARGVSVLGVAGREWCSGVGGLQTWLNEWLLLQSQHRFLMHSNELDVAVEISSRSNLFNIFCFHPVYLITGTVHINQHPSHRHIRVNISQWVFLSASPGSCHSFSVQTPPANTELLSAFCYCICRCDECCCASENKSF